MAIFNSYVKLPEGTIPILKINISVWMLGLQCAAMCRQSLVSIYITSIPSWPSKCQALQMATAICGMIGPGSWANGEPLPWRWLPAKKMEDAQRTHLFSWKPPLRDVESCCQFVIQMPLQCQCIYRDMAWLYQSILGSCHDIHEKSECIAIEVRVGFLSDDLGWSHQRMLFSPQRLPENLTHLPTIAVAF
jgi:hypothetical protein